MSATPTGKLRPTVRATTPGVVLSHVFGAIQETSSDEDTDAARQEEVPGVLVSLRKERWVMPTDVSRLEVLPGGDDDSEWMCGVGVHWSGGVLSIDCDRPQLSHFQSALPAEAEHATSVLSGLQACGESAETARKRMRLALERLRRLPAEGLLDRMLSLEGDELRRKKGPDDAAEYGLMVWAFSTDSANPRHEVLRYRQAGQTVYVMRNELSEAPDRFDYAFDAYDQAGHSAWRGRLVLKREGTPERGVPLINTVLGVRHK